MSGRIDDRELERIVRDTLAEVLAEVADKPSPMGEVSGSLGCDDGFCRPRRALSRPIFDPVEIAKIKHASPARLAQGRTGTRYLTETYIGLRAEHAIARDAVYSEVPDELLVELGCLALKSRSESRQEYLLLPEKGRRLDDESRKRLEAEGTKGADVQIILGGGLSAWALQENGPALLPALTGALEQEGFSLGRPIFVKWARIGVQDEIGVSLDSRSTLICVGERPGLGTGDSMSIYTAFGPALNQDNADKDCISNIRPLGLQPADAATECARLMRRTFDAGGGGVKLTRSGL